jgi:hypothetical protein
VYTGRFAQSRIMLPAAEITLSSPSTARAQEHPHGNSASNGFLEGLGVFYQETCFAGLVFLVAVSPIVVGNLQQGCINSRQRRNLRQRDYIVGCRLRRKKRGDLAVLR